MGASLSVCMILKKKKKNNGHCDKSVLVRFYSKKHLVKPKDILRRRSNKLHYVSYELYNATECLLKSIDDKDSLYYHEVYNFFNMIGISPSICSYKKQADDPDLWKILNDLWKQNPLNKI